MSASHEATPEITPDQWLALTDQWSGPWGDPGHLHNVLDDFAGQLVELGEIRELRDKLVALKRTDDRTYEWCVRAFGALAEMVDES